MPDPSILAPGPDSLIAPGRPRGWGRLIGASTALAAAELAAALDAPVLALARDPRHADQLEAELRFFAGERLPVLHFPEWETLPWDSFSPHQDIVSQRLAVLAQLPSTRRGIIVASATALLQRLPPTHYVAARALSLSTGQTLPHEPFLASLAAAGYLRVPQVGEHGEFAVRGSLIDLFPMGADQPVRIDFFDDEIESLRWFSAESQISGDSVESIAILPAREVPLDDDSVRRFRDRYRERFEGQPGRSRVYRDVSDGIAHGGIEYYLPLFFDQTADLTDYLPADTVVFAPESLRDQLDSAWTGIEERYELCSLDTERPILNAAETFVEAGDVTARLDAYKTIRYSAQTLPESAENTNLATRLPPALRIEARYEDPAGALMQFLDTFDGRALFTSDSRGRAEQVLEMLSNRGIDLVRVDSWSGFLAATQRVGVAVAPLDDGVLLPAARIAIISEQQLFGERAHAQPRRRRSERDPETIIRQLNDLAAGSPVVHAEYGVGRYLGLVTLEAGGVEGEFLQLEYADGDKLYVPVHALELISRYTGASPENAPLHRLGSDQWAKARQRAIKRIRDVAAELLDIHARRAARPGHSFRWSESDYRAFEDGFPFELTEDQARTIDDVLADLASD